jgi:hypothetical protein
VPLGRVEVVTVATPDAFSVAVPTVVVPLRNVTVPVGIPAVEATVAVNVTACPAVDGFGVEVRTKVVVAFVTVKASAGEVLAALLLSPP